MMKQHILFLAPSHIITRIFPELRDSGIEVSLAENINSASAAIKKSRPDIIISRPTLPGYKVEELFSIAKEDPKFPPIVVTTDKGTTEEAERLMTLGAQDYWLEPLSTEKIKTVLQKSYNLTPLPSKSTLDGHKPEDLSSAPTIIGSNPAIRRVLALAKQVAPSKASVLISGESGTGKEMFARTLHAWSNRSKGPFIAVNCAALPEHLLESELFGHEKGSFTGAIARKLGKFELASGGTILLDEISEMDLALQSKLLRVLQEGEIDRVGGTETIKVDVRVLATTNRDMEKWVDEGKFRQDLFFRLNVIPLRLPSLAERGDDILELANFFINMYTKEYHLKPTKLSQEATTWLKNHNWPGNVRELQNLMERAVLLAGGGLITPNHFLLETEEWPLFDEVPLEQQTESIIPEVITISNPTQALQTHPQSKSTTATTTSSVFPNAVIPLHEMERLMIIKGLEATSGNRTQAAELLGISIRTLRNKLNEYKEQGFTI